MINLIPPKAKKSLAIEYWMRVVSVWMILWAITLVAAICILLPAYVLISSQVEVYATSAAEASQKVASYENVSVALVRASQEARAVMDESEVVRFSEYVSLFRSLEGDTVQISEIDLERAVNGFAPARLSGVAVDRQALASFRDRLQAQDVVESVELPISNLAQDKDIPFSLLVEIKPPESI